MGGGVTEAGQSAPNIPPHLIFKTFREGDDAVTCLGNEAVKGVESGLGSQGWVVVVGNLGWNPGPVLLQLCGSGQLP